MFSVFNRRAEIPAKPASPANSASVPHVIGPLVSQWMPPIIGGNSQLINPCGFLASISLHKLIFTWYNSIKYKKNLYNCYLIICFSQEQVEVLKKQNQKLQILTTRNKGKDDGIWQYSNKLKCY